MYLYKVGERYHKERTHWEAGSDFNWRGSASGSGELELRLFYNNLTQPEIEQITQGECAFAFTVQEGVLFFLHDFGKASPLSDNSYSYHLLAQEEQQLPPVLNPGEMYLLHIILVRAENGMIAGLRSVSLGHNFSSQLFEAIREQATRPFSGHAYDAAIARVYRQYSTSKDLFTVAQATQIVLHGASHTGVEG